MAWAIWRSRSVSTPQPCGSEQVLPCGLTTLMVVAGKPKFESYVFRSDWAFGLPQASTMAMVMPLPVCVTLVTPYAFLNCVGVICETLGDTLPTKTKSGCAYMLASG